jgi:hypothetical protein
MKRINEVWWVPVTSCGSMLWEDKSLTKKGVIQNLDSSVAFWKISGWRIAKVTVKEVAK